MYSLYFIAALFVTSADTFTCTSSRSFLSRLNSHERDNSETLQSALDPDIAKQFKVKICSWTSCEKRSKSFGLEEYALFSGIFERKTEQNLPMIEIDEAPCMGCCKFGPCIGVEHEDYEGYVGLEGMEPNEITPRIFQNIVTEGDLDRVWDSIENAIKVRQSRRRKKSKPRKIKG